MNTNRNSTVYGLLLAVWVAIIAWQVIEHDRVKESARVALLNRARDISNSLSVVIRSQRRFGGIISEQRLEAALQDLMESEELRSVALLNSSGEVVTSAGDITNLNMYDFFQEGNRWEKERAIFVNPVDLGPSPSPSEPDQQPSIILPEPDPEDRRRRDRFSPPWPPRDATGDISAGPREMPGGIPPNASDATAAESVYPDRPREEFRGGRRDGFRGDRERRPRRPPWMSEEEYASLLEKKGLHGFVLVMSTSEFHTTCARDLWLRFFIGGFALVAMISLGLALRNLQRTAALQLRLVRASEMNARLREMNVAAAGLAHETRNPLNIVRGLAQMISRQTDASSEIRSRAVEITEEVDRVSAQLNEFIDYSRPREAKPSPTRFSAVVRDVERALESDKEDKAIQFVLNGPDLMIEADEPLLRQVLFNLLINSIQAVDHGGTIELLIEKNMPDEAYFEVRDNGPGVPANKREEIFRPYYTTHESGTGLGLSVVRQIVLAHGWDIEYVPSENGGAAFRISGLKVTSRPSQ
ncbi:MAG: ATP-binding protein [bacterium]